MKETILKKRHIAVILLVVVFISALTESFIIFYKQNQYNLLRERVTIEANKVQTAINNEINSSLNLVLGLIAYINVIENIDTDSFNRIAEVILRESGIIRNIGLAPDNVISYMYPIKGNEKAIGLDYMKNEIQKDAVIKAIKTGNAVIAGPVDLVQGGSGFIARVPVYKGKNKSEYWGIASIVVDEIKLYSRIKILDSWQWIKYGIKGKDARGIDGEQFFGDESVFDRNPVVFEITLPEGSWTLAAVPKSGWDNVGLKPLIYIRITGYFILLFMSFLLFNLFRSNMKLSYYALIDPLTGIANRRCFHFITEKIFLREKRENGKLYFLYFDLDGFKAVNDNYGHKAGDSVLREAVRRIRKNTRESDIFARMGGDEFLFVPLSVKDREVVKKLAAKIISEVSDPFYFERKTVNIGCSIGISIYPDDGDSIDTLLKLADQAMYSSKSKRGNTVTFYRDIETVIIQ